MEENESARELSLVRMIDASPEKVFRAWTEPALLKQWFTPRPWTVASAELDVRPGGSILHWSEADRKAHEEMAFHQGWSMATDQLAELVTTL